MFIRIQAVQAARREGKSVDTSKKCEYSVLKMFILYCFDIVHTPLIEDFGLTVGWYACHFAFIHWQVANQYHLELENSI